MSNYARGRSNRPQGPSTNQNAGNKFSTYERTSFASPTLAFQRARARELLHKSTQPINNMAAMMSINAVAPVRTLPDTLPVSRTLLGRRMARARALPLARDVNGNHQNAFWPEPWGFETRASRVARRDAAIGPFPAHATDAKVSSEPGTASRGRRASIDARSDRVAALSAARVIRLSQTYRVPSPARERPFPPDPSPQAKLSSKMSSGIKAQRTVVAKVRPRETRTPRPTPRERRSRAVPLAHCRGVRLGRYSHHRYFETAAPRDDRTPGASSAIAIASQRRRVVRGARTTNATGPSDVRARSC